MEQCILSPQHWAQEARDHFPLDNGTFAVTQANAEILYWHQKKYKRTIPLDKATYTPRFRSAPGASKYRAFEAVFEKVHDQKRYVCCRTVHRNPLRPQLIQTPEDRFAENNIAQYASKSKQMKMVQDDIELTDRDNLQSELLQWHNCLGHLSFRTLKAMTMFNILPTRLKTSRVQMCTTCKFGAMTRKPWRKKSQNYRIKVRQVQGLDDCVSVDQMQSLLPGFIGQLKGKLTKYRYIAATVFVDHFSRLTYVHLQHSLSSNNTIAAKRAFETFANKHNVIVKHYHADNGRFSDNVFIQDVQEHNQSISFCAVNVQFQNGIAEKKLRDLSEMARKQLLHAKARWSSAIHLCLWSFALRNAAYIQNSMPSAHNNGLSPIEIFSRATVSPNMKRHHTFGCPVFALDNNLQSGKSLPHWNARSRIGINLEHSPGHSSSVPLVLNTTTGIV